MGIHIPSSSNMFPFIPLILIVYPVTCLNILFHVPTLSHSHISFNTKLAETLANAGHRVTALLALVDDTLTISNATSFTVIQKHVGVPSGHLRQVLWSNPGPYENSSPLNPRIFFKLLKVSSTFVEACRNIALDRDFLEDLKSQKFDVGLVEQYDACGFGLFNAIGIKSTIWLSATGIYRPQSEGMGVDLPYSYVPELFAHFNEEMTFPQKCLNLAIGYTTSFISDIFVQAQQSRIFSKLGYFKDMKTLSQQSSAVLLNSAPFFDYSIPTSHQFSNIGGFTVDRKKQELNTYWKSIADSSINGFILVSFGGIARTIDMSIQMQKIFFHSFSQFPQIAFIVKYETCNITIPIPENVILTPWIPQLPLMAHKNYKSIITHGGWSSILETTIYSKPMILMPLFADHAKNSKVAESNGVAVLLDKMKLTRRHVVSAIHKILTDSSFTKNCKKFSKMFNDAPISHEAIIDWRVRQAAKMTRRKFEKFLKPKGFKILTFDVMIVLFLLFTSVISLKLKTF